MGKHLITGLLNEGHDVTVVGREAVIDARLRWIEHDLRHEPSEEIKTQLHNISAVIHLAALMPSKSGDGEEIVVQNKAMTKNVLSLVDSPKVFILASSVDVYPYSDLSVNEDTPLEPISDYGRSKKESEEESVRWWKRNSKTTLTILRFSHLYGSADTNTKMVDTLVRNALLGKKSKIYGQGRDKRTYLHVGDAVRAIKSVLKAAKPGIFNVGGEKAYSLNEVIQTIEKKIPVKILLENIPTENPTENKAGDSIISSERFMKTFNFIPEINLQDGLSSLVPKNIFFDLDGPILEVRERYYRVYREFVIGKGGIPLPIDEYWENKRNNVSLDALLKLSKCERVDAAEFKRHLAIYREDPSFLKFDKLQPEIITILSRLSQNYTLYLITLRRKKENLLRQLEELGILRYFKEVLTTTPTTEDKWSHKAELLKKNHLQDQAGIIIGDTPTEIIAGKKTGLTTIAVSNGIRTEEILLQAGPHLIIDSVKEIQSLPFFKR